MAALSGEKTLAELSAEFGVHPTMISGWKQEEGGLHGDQLIDFIRNAHPREQGLNAIGLAP
jgi:hypothetical protein